MDFDRGGVNMSRRRFHALPEAFLAGGKPPTLGADEMRHARDVLRLKSGDEVYVFDGKGREYRCSITRFNRNSATLDLLEEVKPARSESPLKLSLCVGLLKGEKFDWVVQKSTELGVGRLIPLLTSRGDVRLRNFEETKRKVARWERIALEASKQCGRATLMQVDAPIAFAELLASDKGPGCRLMFAERDGSAFAEILQQLPAMPSDCCVIVGPEGGWTDVEINQASQKSWRIVTLGGRTLRAETAAIVAITLLQHRFGDLV